MFIESYAVSIELPNSVQTIYRSGQTVYMGPDQRLFFRIYERKREFAFINLSHGFG